MELRHIKYFLAVAEELNFTKAAEKLFISQPPLSRQIKDLEKEIGAQLFERNNKKVTLTEAGRYYKEQMIEQLKSIEAITLHTKKIAENVNGEYRIAYISSTFSETITELVQFLIQKYPFLNIKLYEVSTTKQINALELGKIDLGILRAPLVSTKINSRVWFNDSYALVYNNRCIDKQRLNDFKNLKEEVFVFFNKDYAPVYYNSLIEICSQYGFIPNIVHESNNINSILQLVRNGLGISIVPSSLQKSHRYPELSFMDLKNEFSTDVLIATSKEDQSEVTQSIINYLLS